MPKKILICFYFLELSAVFLSCSDNPKGPSLNTRLALSGTVSNTQGEKLEGAGVHFIYKFTEVPWLSKKKHPSHHADAIPIPGIYSLYQNYPNPFYNTTVIRFQVLSESDVRLSVLSYPDKDTIQVITNRTYPAGLFQVVYDGMGGLSNDIYYYSLDTKEYHSTKEMCHLIIDQNELKQDKANGYTDKNGFFEIEYRTIPIGEKIISTSEDGPDSLYFHYITDSLAMVFTKQGYASVQKKVRIDTTRSTNYNIIMNRE
jgi:hypothetical protein